MTDSLHPTSRTPQPAADWRIFADLVRGILDEPAYRSWATIAMPREDGSRTSDPARKMGERRTTCDRDPDPGTGEGPFDVDTLLDKVEREGVGECLPPCPETVPARASHRPRVAVMMAVMRLAKTFESPDAFRTAITPPGAVTLLSGVSPDLQALLERVLDVMVGRDELCPGKPDIHVTSVEDAVAAGQGRTETLFRELSESCGRALERGEPVVLLGGSGAALPASLKAIATTEIALAPLDRTMLLKLMAQVCPDAELGLGDVPADLDTDTIKDLSAASLTLAARAPTPGEAFSRLSRTRGLPDDRTPGLADFPLSPDIRAPIEQMLADMQAWTSGEIGWDDVSRGILLTGPPGCGKTEIPRLLAREAGVEVRASSLSQWQSGGARSSNLLRQMRQVFTEAATARPCIVFIDELDAIGDRDRPHDQNSSWTDSIVGGLLECLDGFDNAPGVVVMAATNHPHKIDAALRRPGRFDRTLTMHQPTPDLLPQAFRWHLRGDLPETDLAPLIAAATGMTGADIAATVRDARGKARRARRPLTIDDLRTAITDRRPSLDPSLRWQVAIHECGHAIVAYATGRARPYLLSLHDAGGETGMAAAPSGLHLEEMQADLACLLAGRAAERLILGRPSGGAGGPEDSDLAAATQRAVGIEVSYGLGETGRAWTGSPDVAVGRLRFDRDLQARVETHLELAERHATDVLHANRDLLEDMARTLSQGGSLSGECLKGFMDRVIGPRTAEDHGPVASERSPEEPRQG